MQIFFVKFAETIKERLREMKSVVNIPSPRPKPGSASLLGDAVPRITGLKLEHRWGDWNQTPFNKTSTKHISVYGRM